MRLLIEYIFYAAASIVLSVLSINIVVSKRWSERAKTAFKIILMTVLLLMLAVYKLSTGEDLIEHLQAVAVCPVVHLAFCPRVTVPPRAEVHPPPEKTADGSQSEHASTSSSTSTNDKPQPRLGYCGNAEFDDLERASSALDAKKYTKAITIYGSVLARCPRDADAYSSRAAAYALKSNSQDDMLLAIADFGAAIRLNPRDDSSYGQRANLRSILKDYDGAFADYRAAIRLNPREGSYRSGLGIALSQSGHDDEALIEFARALKSNSSDIEALSWRASILQKMNRCTEAIADDTRAIAVALRKKEINFLDELYASRGACYAATGDQTHADADFAEEKKY